MRLNVWWKMLTASKTKNSQTIGACMGKKLALCLKATLWFHLFFPLEAHVQMFSVQLSSETSLCCLWETRTLLPTGQFQVGQMTFGAFLSKCSVNAPGTHRGGARLVFQCVGFWWDEAGEIFITLLFLFGFWKRIKQKKKKHATQV